MPEQQLAGSNVQPAPETVVDVGNCAEHGSPRRQPTRRLRSPLAWFGGKGILARKIVPHFPRHHCYVEPFGGGASCLFAKRPSPVEVINDLNSDLVNFFRVLRDPDAFERFHHLVSLTPYSREEFRRYRASWRSGWGGRLDEVERAYRWYVIARMSFAGEFGRGWGHSVATSRLGMANAVAQWLSIVEMLPAIAARIRSVQIEHGDWLQVLSRYDAQNTLFYIDPPFVRSTRRSGRFLHEMADAEHRKLVDALLSIRGKAVVSGYRNGIYDRLQDKGGWHVVDLPTWCHAVGRTRGSGLRGEGALKSSASDYARTETLWMSPNAPASGDIWNSGSYVQAQLALYPL